ncbi:MAG: antibiotic biosynthesis monooxygenase [Ignavibacteriae bacterium]|nr:antibiotic biosynthesis monooxygenase [Ignavibacteriota bacterium]MCB9242704.1 antibiotic biosynthesis monooxygenase [Ignavibacteriales bacterium]
MESLTPQTDSNIVETEKSNGNFVAINYITCDDSYRDRFEELFKSRKHAIDRMPGFKEMEVLKPKDGNVYLIMSHWENEESFKNWTGSEEFLEGHKRGFEDIKKYKERGEEPPLKSDFKTYEIFAR